MSVDDRAHPLDLERATRACLTAMDAAGRSAASCLANPTLTARQESSEASIVAARLLGAFADVATLSLWERRADVAASLAQATLFAAEACAAANTRIEVDVCTAAAKACTAAATELRRLLAAIDPVEQFGRATEPSTA